MWKRNRQQQASRRRSRRGMSLVEVMVVIAIIVTLMSIIGYAALSAYQDSMVQTTQLQMGEIVKRVELRSLKKGPPSTSEGIASLYTDPNDKVPQDSWKHDFVYVSPGPNGMPFDLVSYGSDGSEGGTGNATDLKWSERNKWNE